MAVMNSRNNMKTRLALNNCRDLAPDIVFLPGDNFYWSPENTSVYYVPGLLDTPEGNWALIHETAHALLRHSSYSSDYELLSLEMEAWEKSRQISVEIQNKIDEDHIQNCMDTYRNWLYSRSTCPNCSQSGLQTSNLLYTCVNCLTEWKVSQSRFCRSYRALIQRKTPLSIKKTVFN